MSALDQTLTHPVAGFSNNNLVILVIAQAFLGAQLPMMTILAGLAGLALAPNVYWATLPVAAQAVGSMITSPFLSRAMYHYGRRAGFLIGVFAGSLGAALCSIGLVTQNFMVFSLGAVFTGVYMSSQGFLRFAAMDAVPDRWRPKAMSLVMSGGLVAAIIGPQLVKLTTSAFVVPFLGTYLAVILLNLLGAVLFLHLNLPVPAASEKAAIKGRARLQLLRDPAILRAMLCGMVSYALMILVMTSVPLAVVGIGGTLSMAADIISAHMLAMFVPSFFTGHLISRFGADKVACLGLSLLGAAAIADLSGMELHNFLLGLVLLGIGWNFGFLGATAMLASAHRKNEQGEVQGLNDMFIFAGIAVASASSGAILHCGPTIAAGWQAVNLMTLPFLGIAAAILIAPFVQRLLASRAKLAAQ